MNNNDDARHTMLRYYYC